MKQEADSLDGDGEEQSYHSIKILRGPTETNVEFDSWCDGDYCQLTVHHDDGGGWLRENILMTREDAARIGRQLLEWAEQKEEDDG